MAAVEQSSDHELSQLQRQLHEIRAQLAKATCKAGSSTRDNAVAKLDEVCKLLQHEGQSDDSCTMLRSNAEESVDDHCAVPVVKTEECLGLDDGSVTPAGGTEKSLGDHCAAVVSKTCRNDAFTMTDHSVKGPPSADSNAGSLAVPSSSVDSSTTRICTAVSPNRVKAVVVSSSEVIVPTPSILQELPPPSIIIDDQCLDVAYETVLTSTDTTTNAGDVSLAEADERGGESGVSGFNEDHCYAAADARTDSIVLPDEFDVAPACALETTAVRSAEKRPAETQHVSSEKRKMVALGSSKTYIIAAKGSGQALLAQKRNVLVGQSLSGVSGSNVSNPSVPEGGSSQPLPHQSMLTLLVKDDGTALIQSAGASPSLQNVSPAPQKIIVQMRVLPPRGVGRPVTKQRTQRTACQTDKVIVRRPRKAREPPPPEAPCTAIMKTLTKPVRRSQRRKKGTEDEDDMVQCVVFCCEVCGDCFSAARHLHRHWQNQHKERPEGRHRCSYCPYTSDKKYHVDMHERTHTGERTFACDVCKKSFYRADDVETHMRVHTKEKPFACDECGQSFSVSTNLARHKKLHSDDAETHACPECGKAFTQKVHLKAHLRVHTGDRPYSCTMCSQRFTEQGSARKHEKMVHAGEYPHYCPHCGKGLANNFKLKKHLRARHYELTRAALAAAEAEQEG